MSEEEKAKWQARCGKYFPCGRREKIKAVICFVIKGSRRLPFLFDQGKVSTPAFHLTNIIRVLYMISIHAGVLWLSSDTYHPNRH
jgi:hypothetical protein